MIRASSSVLFWFSLVIAASVGLYRTSDRVHALDQQLRALNTSIEAEQQSIHVLKAEWVYLANPARIESATKKHLALRPTDPQQVIKLSDLSEALPTRSEAMASVSVTATPIANVKTTITAYAPAPRTVVAPKVGAVASVTKQHKAPTVAVASLDTGHINERMIMQHTASAQATPDSIGSLITDLGANR